MLIAAFQGILVYVPAIQVLFFVKFYENLVEV